MFVKNGVVRRILTRSEDDTISLRSKVSDKHVSLENSSSATWITEKGFKLETTGPLLSAFPWWFQKLSNVFARPQNLRKKRTFRSTNVCLVLWWFQVLFSSFGEDVCFFGLAHIFQMGVEKNLKLEVLQQKVKHERTGTTIFSLKDNLYFFSSYVKLGTYNFKSPYLQRRSDLALILLPFHQCFFNPFGGFFNPFGGFSRASLKMTAKSVH